MSRSIKAMVAIYGDEGYILSRWGRKEEMQITQPVSYGSCGPAGNQSSSHGPDFNATESCALVSKFRLLALLAVRARVL